MQRHIAFLRGINVGGHRVTGVELASVFTALGLANASSFLASGNVVFDAEPGKNLGQRIENALKTRLGYAVPTVLRTSAETRAIAAESPFTESELAESKGKLQVTLLLKHPTKAKASQILALATDDDLLAVKGRELYWLPAAGISDSDLDTKALLKILGVQTNRTHNTILRLTKKYLS